MFGATYLSLVYVISHSVNFKYIKLMIQTIMLLIKVIMLIVKVILTLIVRAIIIIMSSCAYPWTPITGHRGTAGRPDGTLSYGDSPE